MAYLNMYKEPWWEEYLSTLQCLLKSVDVTDEAAQNRNTWITITENLVLKLKDVSNSLQNQSCVTPKLRSEIKDIFPETEPLFELFSHIEPAQVKELPEEKEKDRRVVSYLIKSFKLTILVQDKYFYNKEYDPELVQLCTKFLLDSFKVLKVFIVPNPKLVPSENLKRKGEEAVKHLALSIISAPKSRIVQIMLNILPCVLENIGENFLIEVFLNQLSSHRRSSIIASMAVLKYFNNIEFMKTLSHKPHKEVDLLLSVLAKSLECTDQFPDHVIWFHKLSLENIIRNCILLIPTMDNPHVQFLLLKSIFEVLHKNKLISMKVHLRESLSTVFSAFDLWILTPVESKTWCLCLETILIIASSCIPDCIKFMLPFAETIVKTVIHSLKEHPNLATKALTVLEKLMTAVNFHYINSHILPLKHDFLNAIYGALQSPADSVNKMAFSILGKMGGYNRDAAVKETLKLQEAENGDVLSIKLKKYTECINLTLERVIDIAYKHLNWKGAILTKQHSLPVLQVLYSSYIQSNKSNALQSSAYRFLTDPVKDPNFHNCILYPGNPELCRVCKNALIALFVALEIPEFFNIIQPIVKQVTNAFIRKYTDEDLDLMLLIDAALDAMCLSKDSPDDINIVGLQIIVEIAIENLGCAEVCSSLFFKHAFQRVINLCGHSTWEGKIAGCKVISYFLKIVSKDWIIQNIGLVLKVLIYSLANTDGKISFGSSKILKCTIEELLHKCFVSKPRCEMSEESSVTYVVIDEVGSETTQVFSIVDEADSHTNSLKSEGMHERINAIIESIQTENSETVEGISNEIIDNIDTLNDMEVEVEDESTEKVGINEVAEELLLMLCEGAISENCYVRERFRNAIECFFQIFGIVIDKLPDKLFSDVHSVVYFHEDFDFCLKLRMLLFVDHTCDEYKDLYNSLKTMGDFKAIYKLNSHSDRASAIKQCCGALNALLFNFYKPSSNEILGMFFRALQNPIEEISDAGRKCLQHVNTLLNEERDQKCNSLDAELIKHFREWKKSTSLISPNVIFGAQIINLLSTIEITEELYIDEIFSFLCESELLTFAQSQFLENSLKDPLVKFCKRYPYKAIKLIVDKMDVLNMQTLFEELLQSEDFVACLTEKDIINLMSSKYDKRLNILFHMVNYENWFTNKKDLADNLLTKLKVELLNPEERKNITRCLFYYYKCNINSFDLLFALMKVFTCPFSCEFQFLKDFLFNEAAKSYTVNWKAGAFLKFHSVFLGGKHKAEYEILKYIIMPSFNESFKNHEGSTLLNIRLSMDKSHQRKSVLDLYFECLKDICDSRHSEKVNLLFIEFSIGLCVYAQTAAELNSFIENIRLFVKKSCNDKNYHFIGLLLLFLSIEEGDIKNLISIMSKLSKMPYATHAFCIAISRMPDSMLISCLKNNTQQRKLDMNMILNMIVMDHSNFKNLYYVPDFMKNMLKSAVKKLVLKRSDIEVFKHRKMAVDLLEVVFKWFESSELDHYKSLVSAENAKTIVNGLFQIVCFVDSNSYQDSLSERCISLLKKIFIEQMISVSEIGFDDWLRHLLNEISKIPERCKVFELVTELIDDIPEYTVASFVKYLNNCFENDNLGLLSGHCRIKVLETVCSFLSKLLTRFPPLTDVSEFQLLYQNIKDMFKEPGCMIKNSGFMLLEAVECHFPSIVSTLKDSLTGSLSFIIENYPTFDYKTVLIAALVLMKKIFFKLTDESGYDKDLSTGNINDFNEKEDLLFKNLPSLIAKLSHAEILLKIFDIVELYINYLQTENVLYEVYFVGICNVLKTICQRIDSHFSDNKEMSMKLLDKIIDLRSYNESGSRANDVALKEKVNVIFYMAGMFSKHPENRKRFFKIIAQEFRYRLSSILNFIFGSSWKLMKNASLDSKFSVKECINLISVMVQKGSVIVHGLKDKEVSNMPEVFFSIVELCYADEVLAKSVWIELFPQLWNLLNGKEQKNLFNVMTIFFKSLSSKNEDSLLHRNDSFIIAALKCNIEFVFHVDIKYIHRSFDFQIYSTFLMRNLLKNDASMENRYKVMDMFNEVYSQLEESDIFYCFNESISDYLNISHLVGTLVAMSCHQEGKVLEAYYQYKNPISEPYINVFEKKFCISQHTRCINELIKWDIISTGSNISLLEDAKILAKWDIKISCPSEALMPKCYNCNEKKMHRLRILKKEEIPTVISQSIKTWRSLPQNFLSNRHYSLLFLIQQLTELSEGWNLLNKEMFSNKKMWQMRNNPNNEKIKKALLKKLNTTCHEWQQRPHLMSDEYRPLMDLYHVRKFFLQNLQKHLFSEQVAHEISICDTELLSIIFKHQNVHLRSTGNGKLYKFLSEKVFSLKQMKLLKPLLENGEKDPRSFFEQPGTTVQDEEKKRIFESCNISQDLLNQTLVSDYLFENPGITGAVEILCGMAEKYLGESSDVTDTVSALITLLLTCKYEDASVPSKLMPKLLHLLESEDEKGSIANVLLEHYCDICDSYWIPFLPFLISQLSHNKERPLSDVLTSILIKVARTYPQQVFFGVQGLRFRELNSTDEGSRMASKKCDKIINTLYKMYPRLVQKFNDIVKVLDVFKLISHNVIISKLEEALDKTYHCVLKNLKEDKNILDTTEIVDSLVEIFESQEIVDTTSYFQGLSAEISSEGIVDLIKASILENSKAYAECQKEILFELSKKLQFLNSYPNDDVNISVFGQSVLMNPSFHVKLHKFLPEVDGLNWNNKFVFKIKLLGCDGKVYPYLILEDFLRKKETFATIKLMQFLENLNPLLENNVQSSKRFLKYNFPSITPMGSHFMFIPYNSTIPYLDICQMYTRKCGDLPVDMYFKEIFGSYGVINKMFLMGLIKSVQSRLPKDILKNYVEALFPYPFEKFMFRKQFLKHISLLIASEYFFNISAKQLLIGKNNGMVTAQELEFRLDDNAAIHCLTHNIKEYIGPFGIKIITQNLMGISACLKDNKHLIQPLLQLLKKEYSKDEIEEINTFAFLLKKELNCINREKIDDLLKSSPDLYSLNDNPFVYPWF